MKVWVVALLVVSILIPSCVFAITKPLPRNQREIDLAEGSPWLEKVESDEDSDFSLNKVLTSLASQNPSWKRLMDSFEFIVSSFATMVNDPRHQRIRELLLEGQLENSENFDRVGGLNDVEAMDEWDDDVDGLSGRVISNVKHNTTEEYDNINCNTGLAVNYTESIYACAGSAVTKDIWEKYINHDARPPCWMNGTIVLSSVDNVTRVCDVAGASSSSGTPSQYSSQEAFSYEGPDKLQCWSRGRYDESSSRCVFAPTRLSDSAASVSLLYTSSFVKESNCTLENGTIAGTTCVVSNTTTAAQLVQQTLTSSVNKTYATVEGTCTFGAGAFTAQTATTCHVLSGISLPSVANPSLESCVMPLSTDQTAGGYCSATPGSTRAPYCFVFGNYTASTNVCHLNKDYAGVTGAGLVDDSYCSPQTFELGEAAGTCWSRGQVDTTSGMCTIASSKSNATNTVTCPAVHWDIYPVNDNYTCLRESTTGSVCACPADRTGPRCVGYRGFVCDTSMEEPTLDCGVVPGTWDAEYVSGDPVCLQADPTDNISFKFRTECRFVDLLDLEYGIDDGVVPDDGVTLVNRPFEYYAVRNGSFAMSKKRNDITQWFRVYNFRSFGDSYTQETDLMTPAQLLGDDTTAMSFDVGKVAPLDSDLYSGGRLYFEAGFNRNFLQRGMQPSSVSRQFLDVRGQAPRPGPYPSIFDVPVWLPLVIVVGAVSIFFAIFSFVRYLIMKRKEKTL
jgi:hypothetical protein